MKASAIKRALALLAALIMVLGLAACTDTTTDNNGDTTTTAAANVATTTAPTEVTDPTEDVTDPSGETDPSDVTDPSVTTGGGEVTAPTQGTTQFNPVDPTNPVTPGTTQGGNTPDTTQGGNQVTTQGNKVTTTVQQVATTTKQPGKETNLTKEQVMAAMPANLKGTTLTYFYWNDPMTQMDGEAINGWKAATGCNFKFESAAYASFQEELSVRITSNNSPDLVRLLGPVTWQVTALQSVDSTGFNFNDKAWDDEVMKQYTYNGKCYALNLNNSAISDVSVLYFNLKALQDADMDNDTQNPYKIWKNNPNNWTWAKFWELCDDFVDANTGKTGYVGATFEYNDAYMRAMGGCAYYYDAAKGKMVNNMKNAATESGLKVTAEMMQKGLLVNGHNETAFDQGRVLFFWSGPFSARAKDTRQSALKKRNRLGVVPLPTDSKYQVMYEYTAFGIPKGAKNPKLVPYYLRWVLDRSSYDWSKVYCNAAAQEVLDYATAKTNRFYGYSAGMTDVYAAAYKAGPAQVKSVLDSYYDEVQTFIDNENERIAIWGEA